MSNLPKLLLTLSLIAAAPLAAQPAFPAEPLSSPAQPAQPAQPQPAQPAPSPSELTPEPALSSNAETSPVPVAEPSSESAPEAERLPASEASSFPVSEPSSEPTPEPEHPPTPEASSSPEPEDERPAPPPAPEISPQAALVGVYVGDLPCADCPGQRWHLTLGADHHYRLHLTYLDRGVVELFGRWRLEEDGKLHLKDDTENITFQVVGNRLRLLDQAGQPIASSFNYDLARQQEAVPLQGTEWQLRRLEGQKLASDAILLRLEAGEERFSGFGGCNRILGAYRLADKRLEFSRIVGTKMLCLGDDSMALESALLKALMQVKVWEIQGGWLYLRDVAGKVLLELEAAEAQAEASEAQEGREEAPDSGRAQ